MFQARESTEVWKPSLCIACANLKGCPWSPTAHNTKVHLVHCQRFEDEHREQKEVTHV